MRNKLLLGAVVLGLSACVTVPPNGTNTGNSALLSQASPKMAQTVQANPQSSDAWFQLGNEFAEQDQLINAEAAYRQSLMLGPNAKAQHNLGLVHIRLGIEALRSSAEQLPANDPARAETRQFLKLMSKAGY